MLQSLKEEKLGIIKEINFGIGGFKNKEIGLVTKIKGKDWEVEQVDLAYNIMLVGSGDSQELSLDNIGTRYAEIISNICNILKEAGVRYLSDLVGMKVKVFFEEDIPIRWKVIKSKGQLFLFPEMEEKRKGEVKNKNKKTEDSSSQSVIPISTFDSLEFILEFIRTTEMAYLVKFNDEDIWFPKSQVIGVYQVGSKDDNFYKFIIPEWLALSKNLITEEDLDLLQKSSD